MFWGDIALEHPDLIKTLPKDLIVASWEYFSHPDYDKWLNPFVAAGMKIFVCPWVGNTSLMMPDYEQAAANIGTFLTEVAAKDRRSACPWETGVALGNFGSGQLQSDLPRTLES